MHVPVASCSEAKDKQLYKQAVAHNKPQACIEIVHLGFLLKAGVLQEIHGDCSAAPVLYLVLLTVYSSYL